MRITYHAPESGYTPLPKGTYDLDFHEATTTLSKRSQEPQLVIHATVHDGVYQGAQVAIFYTLSAAAAWKFDELVQAIGLDHTIERTSQRTDRGQTLLQHALDTDDLVGLRVRFDVDERTYEGRVYNNYGNPRLIDPQTGALLDPAHAASPAIAPVQATTGYPHPQPQPQQPAPPAPRPGPAPYGTSAPPRPQPTPAPRAAPAPMTSLQGLPGYPAYGQPPFPVPQDAGGWRAPGQEQPQPGEEPPQPDQEQPEQGGQPQPPQQPPQPQPPPQPPQPSPEQAPGQAPEPQSEPEQAPPPEPSEPPQQPQQRYQPYAGPVLQPQPQLQPRSQQPPQPQPQPQVRTGSLPTQSRPPVQQSPTPQPAERAPRRSRPVAAG